MNEEEIIASGLLELYVTDSLSKEDSLEVEAAMAKFPKVREEIVAIEAALMRLSESAANDTVVQRVWHRILNATREVRQIDADRKPKRSLAPMLGWAAAILIFAGLAYMLKENNDLKDNLRTVNTKKVLLEEKANTMESRLAEANDLLEVVRSKEFKAVVLPGNAPVAASAYATVYYNDEEKVAYIDAKGLPTPPEGKVYQVWSLIMDPLTPRSMGTLDTFTTSETKFFRVDNVPTPEGFGITLEPAGGSEGPTLSQLYVLGTVSP